MVQEREPRRELVLPVRKIDGLQLLVDSICDERSVAHSDDWLHGVKMKSPVPKAVLPDWKKPFGIRLAGARELVEVLLVLDWRISIHDFPRWTVTSRSRPP